MTRSGWSSVAISHTSAQNAVRMSARIEPEVSMMTAMPSIPSERIDGR